MIIRGNRRREGDLMKNHILIAALGAAVFAATAAANAETLKVTWDEPAGGGVMASWLQSSDPTPSDYGTDMATTVPVTDFTGTIGPYTSIAFYNAVLDGGFSIFAPGNPTALWAVQGAQMYTGSEAAPIFAPGVFAVQDFTNGLDGNVSFTVAAPEPPVWTLMIAGLAALGVWRCLRRTPILA
jgi:hypothetical protein